MKKLLQICAVGLLVVTAVFTPAIGQTLYPELTQSFKDLKKVKIDYDRQDVLTGVQQMGIMAKQQKKPVLIELIGNDGFSGPIAKAVLKAALANNGISDVQVVFVGTAASDKVSQALLKMGFKMSGREAKYNDQSGSVTLESTATNPQGIHVLLSDDAASLLSAPDKFAVKLHYPADVKAELIAAEMVFVANKIKENWKY